MANVKKTLPEINACLFKDGVYHSELELNQVSFPFTGRIEAQTPLCADFIGEVGMILVVDKWAVNGPEIRPMTEDDTATSLFCLNYSTELSYDERKPGLRYFYQRKADPSYDWLSNGDKDDIYPRMGYLSVGEKFTTSAIDLEFEVADTASTQQIVAAFKAALNPAANGTAIINDGDYLCAGPKGYWVKCDAEDAATAIGPVVRILDKNLGMADKSFGFKVEVVKA